MIKCAAVINYYGRTINNINKSDTTEIYHEYGTSEDWYDEMLSKNSK